MKAIIQRKVLIAMIFTAITMMGYFSFRQLPIELFPNTQVPYLFVMVNATIEVDPKYMETQAIIPLEGAVGTLKGVEKIESQADVQQGRIQISFQPSTNVKYAYLKLLAKVDEIKKTLPKEFMVSVFKFDLSQMNNDFMTLQVRGSGGVDRVRQVVDKEIANKLKNINGIANVGIFGGREKSIDVILREDVCKANNISPADVRNALTQNSSVRTFAGKVTHKNQLVFINVVSEYTELSDLQELPVGTTGSLRLKDVADIRFGVKELDSYSRVNGKESVTIQLTRDSQSNMIELANKVKQQVAALNETLHGKDIVLDVQKNSAETMETNISQIINLALVGGILAIFILWIFLRNIRLVVAIALAIPISIYSAYNFFYFYGVSINSLTLLGMALAIGMLLDNSVVVMENIYRLASQKVGAETAVIQGTREVWRSVVAATCCMVMVFLPFAFSTNFLVGMVGKNIGVSIVSTLLISLVVALMLIPMITHAFLKFRGKERSVKFESISFHNRLVQIYMVLLKTCMRNPAKTIMGLLGVFFLTLIISLGLSMVSNQEPEVTNLTLYVTLPGGTTLNNTDKVISEIEKTLEGLPEKKELISQIYEEEAVLTVTLRKDFRDVRHYQLPRVKQEILDKLRNSGVASLSWDPPISSRHFGRGEGNSGFGESGGLNEMMGFGSQNESVIIKGPDYEKIVAQANNVKYFLSQLQTLESVTISLPSGRPQLMMDFDKPMMALYDIPATSVLSELNAFPKEFASGATFKQGTEEYDIRIKVLTPAKQPVRDLNDLKKLTVHGTAATTFELQNIANFNFAEGASIIKRTNQEKQLEVQYKFISEIKDDKELLEASQLEVEHVISGLKKLPGVNIEVIHEKQDFNDFKFLILAALLLIFMILASVFESLVTPVVLMFAIPLAAIGSLLALIITGNSILSVYTLTGFVILIGIVVNNGIILVDYSRVLESRGYRPFRALMMAGLARIRPILITSMTTVIALIPLAMGKAEYVTKIGAPFAITIIGGLSLSTLLTLIFIPTQYSGTRAALTWIGSQKTVVKILQLVGVIAGIYLIYNFIDSLIWKIVDCILIVVLIPASTYFVKTSLRKASETLIGEDEPITIHIRNLVKIYDRDGRFMREWKSGVRLRERLGLERDFTSLKDFDYLFWKLPLMGFLLYFIYVHLESGLWYFLLPIVLYLLLLSILSPFRTYAMAQKPTEKRWLVRFIKGSYTSCFWVFPLAALYLFHRKFGLMGLIIPTALVWYLLLFVKVTSDKIYKERVNVNRLSGRLKNLRKGFYRFVMIIPIIGKKKIPFKALKGVSFTIENGMFGLLGPNGAGKSTLMRIICGILEPSYGQITINNINVAEKREELQGLIGYLPQEFGMYENLTAWEFLNYMGILKKLYNQNLRQERISYVLHAVHMFEQKDQKIGSFSGGMKQRIGIAQILLHLPRILVVDEPTAGLDPRERIRFRNLLVELSKDRVVIFSTHIIEDVASSCNRLAVVKKGQLKYIGEPIQMARIAEGKIWILDMSMEAFEIFKESHVIIHHMRDGEFIRVRCLSDEKPHESARPTKANLEDAYLYLLHMKN